MNEIVELRIAAPMWLLVALAVLAALSTLLWLVGVVLELRTEFLRWRLRRKSKRHEEAHPGVFP